MVLYKRSLGRKAIGSDVNPKYLKLAGKRIEAQTPTLQRQDEATA